MAVISVWGIEQILATLLMCRPISCNWEIVVDGHCGNTTASLIAGAGINTLYVDLSFAFDHAIAPHLHLIPPGPGPVSSASLSLPFDLCVLFQGKQLINGFLARTL